MIDFGSFRKPDLRVNRQILEKSLSVAHLVKARQTIFGEAKQKRSQIGLTALNPTP